jgi:hypothetical protein
MNRTALALVSLVALAGCPGNKSGPAPMNKITSGDLAPPVSPVVSSDILAREPLANTASVKHILISWKDLADAFGGHLDPRAEKRTKADAEALVRSLLQQLQAGTDFDTLMKASSEDNGSAVTGIPFTVTPDAKLVIEFRQLSLRLGVGEVGVCQSDYGFHIIKRFG